MRATTREHLLNANVINKDGRQTIFAQTYCALAVHYRIRETVDPTVLPEIPNCSKANEI